MTARYRIVVPVRDPREALPRSCFAPDVRARLSLAMAQDTLRAIGACRVAHDLVVVSPSQEAARLASEVGAEFVHSPRGMGLNAAIEHAFTSTRQAHDRMVAAVVGDLPTMESSELTQVLAQAGRHHETVHVRDLGGIGVTLHAERVATFQACLAADPVRRLKPRGAEVAQRVPGLRCDVDSRAGLRVASFLGLGAVTHTVARDLDLLPRQVALT